jgi:hypothetical protein
MTTKTIPHITALQAQAVANGFLSDHLPDRFTADQACFAPQDDLWHVPVILTYPFVGALGTVGEILVAAQAEVVIAYTPLEEMRHSAQRLYDARRNEIEAAFL